MSLARTRGREQHPGQDEGHRRQHHLAQRPEIGIVQGLAIKLRHERQQRHRQHGRGKDPERPARPLHQRLVRLKQRQQCRHHETANRDFAVVNASSYSSSGGRGSYLLTGDLVQMTTGPKKGERFVKLSDNFLREIDRSGAQTDLRCVRQVANNR